MKSAIIVLVFSAAAITVFSQPRPGVGSDAKATVRTSFGDAAAATFAAHGGSKLKAIKTLVIKGSVDVTVQAQSLPGGFSTVISGNKYILDIQTAFQSIKQTFDGQNTVSSINGFTLPPVTSLGFPLLPRIGDEGYVVSSLPEGKKKESGFRVTAPDGFYTDFYIDEKTKLIKSYESAYEVKGRVVTTSVEVDKFRVVDGVTIPERYAQRFDLGQLTAYANFKAKDILINSPIDDAVFGAAK
ncbi:MAG: hypothetical protein AB7V18_04285 [Pyrinomonadaceae bacterium]